MKKRAKRRSPEQWADIIQAQTHSGKTIRAFCADQEIALASFGKWKHRLAETGGDARRTTPSEFQPVRLVEPVPDPVSPVPAPATQVTLSIGAVVLTIEHAGEAQ